MRTHDDPPRAPSVEPPEDVTGRLRAAGCVFAEDEAAILISAANSSEELASMVARREAGLPLEHVVGWAEFCGERVLVDEGVFVPRFRTELLVRESLSRLAVDAVVVDLCCGSGAVGAVLNAHVAGLRIHAVDIDAAAVRCARRNLPTSSEVHLGDLFDPLPPALRGRVDLVVANAPYVPTDELRLLPPEARLHESRTALDGGADGLDVLRRVVDGAADWLAPGGHVIVETSLVQAPVLVDELVRAHLVPRTVTSEELEATVVVGRRPGMPPA